MRAREDADGSLIVEHSGFGWARLLFGIALLCLFGAAFEASANAREGERILGLLGGGAVSGVAGLAMLETGRFRFARKRRVVEWRRRWAWWTKEGSIPFEQVLDVLVGQPIGDSGVPSRRISLRLKDGRELPLRAAYVADADGSALELAARIRVALGLAVEPPLPASVRALARAGRRVEAVRLLREESGLALDEAVRKVDELASATS
jgi:hypothetical protein